MTKAARIQDCIDHHDEYVLTMAAMPDRRLREKLDTIHLQMALAEQKRDTDAIELLEVWRAQTIEARIYKAENNIVDEIREIDKVIADIETYIAEPMQMEPEAVTILLPERIVRQRNNIADDKSEQLSFF